MPSEIMKILIVEDNPGDMILLREVFKEFGNGEFKLNCVDRLTDALKELSGSEVDAVLLDLSLPESTGLETLVQVLEADSLAPIIVVTGLNDEATAYKALGLGAQDYIVKGEINGERLVRALRFSVIRNRQKNLVKLEEVERGSSGPVKAPPGSRGTTPPTDPFRGNGDDTHR